MSKFFYKTACPHENTMNIIFDISDDAHPTEKVAFDFKDKQLLEFNGQEGYADEGDDRVEESQMPFEMKQAIFCIGQDTPLRICLNCGMALNFVKLIQEGNATHDVVKQIHEQPWNEELGAQFVGE